MSYWQLKPGKKIIKFYKSLALQTFNTFVLIFLLNLIIAGFFWIRNSLSKHNLNVDQRVLTHREKYSDIGAYTHMMPDEVKTFLDEQDAMGSIGFQHEPWVQFRNPEFYGVYLNTDVRGFRKTKEPESSGGDPIKIFIFGGSTTFGYGVADDYTIPSFMQKILERQYPGTPIVVKNYGQGFYYSTQEMLLLISLIKEKNIPNFVVFIDGANDSHQLQFMHDQPHFTGIIKDLWNTRGNVSSQNREEAYLWIPMIRLAKEISKRLEFGNPSGKALGSANQQEVLNNTNRALLDANSPAFVVSRYKSNMRIIRSLCREYDIRCYFIWQPVPFYKYDRSLHRLFPYEGAIPKYWSTIYKTMKYYSSPDFLYLGEFLSNVQEKVFVDDVHYNEEFNAKIAAAICEFLNPDLEFLSPARTTPKQQIHFCPAQVHSKAKNIE
jgi:hypothetical protein